MDLDLTVLSLVLATLLSKSEDASSRQILHSRGPPEKGETLRRGRSQRLWRCGGVGAHAPGYEGRAASTDSTEVERIYNTVIEDETSTSDTKV